MTDFNLSANNSQNFSQDLLISAESYIAVACILFLIGFFGFSLNLSVILFMWKEKQLWTPLNIILFNLVVSDFLVSILGNPWTFVSALNYKWMFGKTGCVLYGFIMSLLGITSITTLTVLAFERYLMIARPFRSNVLNFKSAYLVLMVIWLYSLSVTTPPLVGWGEYGTEAAGISCSVNWEEKSTNSTTYILYLFVFGLFLPLTVIILSYANIIIRMRRNAFKMGQVNKAETKVAYMILTMIAAFLIAWSPYAILALIIQFGDSSFVTPGIAVVPALVAKSSICYNPIIYIGLNVQFQQTWKLSCKARKNEISNDALRTSDVMEMETKVELRVEKKKESSEIGNRKQRVNTIYRDTVSEITIMV